MGRRRKKNKRLHTAAPPTGGDDAHRSHDRLPLAMGGVAIVFAVLTAYVPAINGGFIWDDARYVTDNETLRTADGLRRIWFDIGATVQYYPLVFTTFWLEHHLWGVEPLGYHLVNVLIHAANALLVWIVLRRLSLRGAWLAAMIFALHPVHVESVAWITERKNVLSGFFYLSALAVYLRFEPLDAAAALQPRRWRFYGAATGLFVCALLSKTVACSLPAVILLLVWWKRGRLRRSRVVPLLPLFVIGAGMAAMTAWMEQAHVRAVGVDWTLSALDRCLIAGRALWFYVWKLFWPLTLTFSYPKWNVDSALWWSYLFPSAAVCVVLCLAWLRGRIGRGPLVAMLLFGGTLVPALGFVNTYPMRYSYVADHFQYLSSISLIALFATWVSAVGVARKPIEASRMPARAGGRVVRGTVVRRVGAGLLIVVLGVLTWRQGHAYKDLETLWRDTLAKNPSAFLAHCNLGWLLVDRGEMSEAYQHFAAAVRLKPNFHEAHCGMGKTLIERGEVDEGIAHYVEAVRLRPDMVWAHTHLAMALDAQGRADEAIVHYQRVVQLAPQDAQSRSKLATALARRGRTDEAIQHFKAAVRLRPDWTIAHSNLGNALAELGRFAEAEASYQVAIQQDPEYAMAHRNLALALENQGKIAAAITEYRTALRLDPRLNSVRRALDALTRGTSPVTPR